MQIYTVCVKHQTKNDFPKDPSRYTTLKQRRFNVVCLLGYWKERNQEFTEKSPCWDLWGISAQRWPRSACASAVWYQGIRYPLEEPLPNQISTETRVPVETGPSYRMRWKCALGIWATTWGKSTLWHAVTTKTQISLLIRTVWPVFVVRTKETFHPWLSKMRPVNILIRLRGCAIWSESSLGAHIWR